MPRLQAYGPSAIYTHADVAALVQFCFDRAIRLVPEFDLPAYGNFDSDITLPSTLLWTRSRAFVCFSSTPPPHAPRDIRRSIRDVVAMLSA